MITSVMIIENEMKCFMLKCTLQRIFGGPAWQDRTYSLDFLGTTNTKDGVTGQTILIAVQLALLPPTEISQPQNT